MLEKTRIILASASPRRKELLARLDITFEIITSDIEEHTNQTAPEEIVKELSQMKAADVFNKIIGEESCKLSTSNQLPNNLLIHNQSLETNKYINLIVIGADTVVSQNNLIMGKPTSRSRAYEMIDKIQGDTHQVYTGVTILNYNYKTKELTTHTFAECTKVTAFPMTKSEINNYLDNNVYEDKAGAYGIQEAFGLNIKKIDGDYDNVVGLPTARLYQYLKNID